MQALYSESSHQEVSSQLNRRLIVLGAVLAVLLGVFVYATAVRIEWLAIAAACAAGCFAVFYVELFCLPLSRYRRLIRSALHGRRHTISLEYVCTEPDESMVDGVRRRSLVFLGDPDKHGTREQMLYWDAELPLPSLQPGQQVSLEYTDRSITGITPEAVSSRP